MEAKITPLRLLIFAVLVAGFLARFGYWPAHVPRDSYFDRRRIARAWFACASLFCAGAGLACFVEREFGMFPPTSLRPFIIAGGVALMLVAVVWMHSLRAGFLPTLFAGVVHPAIGIGYPEVTNHEA